jgi:hypothetical protein
MLLLPAVACSAIGWISPLRIPQHLALCTGIPELIKLFEYSRRRGDAAAAGRSLLGTWLGFRPEHSGLLSVQDRYINTHQAIRMFTEDIGMLLWAVACSALGSDLALRIP